MILIDPNVVVEPWRPSPDPRALAWIDAQTIETLYLSAVTVAELRFGIAATAAARSLTAATRDIGGPFEAAGVPMINPWRDSG